MPPTILHSPLPLTSDCHHYTDISQVPWDIQKYYHQRHSLFHLYSSSPSSPSIHLTDAAWFGVTPEPVALQIAHDLDPPSSPTSSPTTIIDIFAGAGGNAIAFALSGKWSRVVAIERDAATLACAQNNARVYGVYDEVVWILGDSFEVLALLRAQGRGKGGVELSVLLEDMAAESTVVFASPPWGGVSYADRDVFDLSAMEPYNLAEIHEACRPMRHVLFLPRTSDIRQVAALVPKGKGEKVDVVQYCMHGASKGMVAYIPAAGEQDAEETSGS
ncbi:RNA cap guanine-N2 methyltransferase-domain-containing protein [Schizothecium vesticola]|uniref:Trimethylguanosine synthase n=1 Tax=Schizothecium vesticola TaxID=314040 RepID=A0AA40K4X6_9PEZI|nr:RNA cap guanine-N2 methyltransferase-domain-containing protein [Schizothecium vesticola]